MNKKKLLALLVSSAFLFAACGDDDNPSSPKNNDTEISSSSEEDDCDSDECEVKSSSSKTDDKKSSDSKEGDKKSSDSKNEKSSSSTKNEGDKSSSSVENKANSSSSSAEAPKSSSSVDVPKGARAAKLTDLEKNVELKLFDQTVYLSTGSKQGLVALRIPNEMWIVTYTDFANGEVKFVDGNVGKQYAETDAVKKILEKLKDKNGFTISFIVDENGVVKYAVNGSKEYSEAVKASVTVAKGKVSKAEDIKDKIYKCTDGDTTRTFTFFDNSYIVENGVGDKVAYWIGGHYDIQRSTLLMRPAYYNKPVYSMYAYSVGTENTISMSNGETTTTMSCNVESSEYKYEKASDFVGEWQNIKDGIEWNFTLKADGSYELSAFEGQKNVESKSGVWEVYGYHLMMRNSGCLHPDKCTSSIHGQLQTGPIDKATNKISGFSFIHSDPDTPKIPTSFEAPQYE
ncbi:MULTISPECIES: hypothetical protein [unclassified Fibrobacter]|uniref:hypothetical protein n=1 Tax=unclassified Fibrobacter TaxID=2634177 RepID=UPI000922F085|nr:MULTISPECIES: hypothetical protein [unclassified Fibrobacter]SHK92829.1 hypothetical protein SAMN05720759_10941 [Fibrobacter sp. UWB12]SIO07458.1 hypothetical protein SAMN05720758_1288 [Fibrobacter sp. UWB11]